MQLKCINLILAFTVGVGFSNTSANADNFAFMFTNTSGNVPGTVTGEILGITNNSTGPASRVLIDSFPGAFVPTPFSLPIDASLFPNQFQNSFTEVSGSITSARFDADTRFSPTPPNQFVLNFTNTFGQFFDTTSVPACCSILQNTTGPISFTAESPVPEPAALSLVLGGVAWLLLLKRVAS